ncbi:LytR/AlgR family response regulator transcription factor [Mucilaginibacter sp. X5P1]|uniref:LytR/AlgR family response regulator transcription factor n=1 Tax=Mucilaginibacter sp. X5P1 TaxID=2723088 RepID=UPI001616ED79|nr:LytTR family DNA-binding domain-containing protein [Mucilaginibacter sp. X5P1]MBB6137935.1 DNA-binding LytR/AlgR family response regulator [Mucilaginibacter sp. X5P1]
MIIPCIAVDDEPIALNLICSYIEQIPFLKLEGSFSNAVAALKAIHEKPSIKLAFLDIRMAHLSGVELAKIINQSENKQKLRVIFTTAFDQYAVESYKVEALDYLLKPFNFVDFSKAAAKALEYFSMCANVLVAQQNHVPPLASEKEYIYLKVDYQLVKVDLNDILYIEGLKDYVKVFVANEAKPLLTLTSLKVLEEKLPEKNFLRIHRSFIVSLEKIKSVTKNSVQIGETVIAVTGQYKEPFLKFISKWG